jgi:hypothetical protein
MRKTLGSPDHERFLELLVWTVILAREREPLSDLDEGLGT